MISTGLNISCYWNYMHIPFKELYGPQTTVSYLLQGRSNRYGQSRTDFWQVHRLLIKTLKLGVYRFCLFLRCC